MNSVPRKISQSVSALSVKPALGSLPIQWVLLQPDELGNKPPKCLNKGILYRVFFLTGTLPKSLKYKKVNLG